MATSSRSGRKLTALEEAKKTIAGDGDGSVKQAYVTGKQRGDTAWMLTASALVLLMVPGLALFYGGMVRRKNVLATMMQSMAALAVVGVYWIADRLRAGVRPVASSRSSCSGSRTAGSSAGVGICSS